MIFSLVMIPLCLMSFALYTYLREEKYRIYYGVHQLFKETCEKRYAKETCKKSYKIETSENNRSAPEPVV